MKKNVPLIDSVSVGKTCWSEMKILIAYITLNEMEVKFEIWNRLEIHENAQ